ncbi:MAG TPA: flippase [Bacteroidota bacterium]|nr:flippase [Bacteroidota bacterium]
MTEQNEPTKHPLWIWLLPFGIRRRILENVHLEKILLNTGWLVFDKVFRMGVGLVVVVWIARYLGPGQFGSLNYAISLSALFGSIAGLGLESIVVREIVHDPSQKDTVLGTALALRVAGGVFAVVFCMIATFTISTIDPGIRLLVFVIVLGYIFQAFDVVDFWFQAKVQSKFSVISKSIVFFSLSVLRIVCILAQASLVVFAVLATIEIVLGSIAMVVSYRIFGNDVRAWNYSRSVAARLLKDSWPLILAGMAIVAYLKIDQVLLGSMLDMKSVGVYSAAVRMVEVWYFIPGTITVSVFPSLVEARKNNREQYLRWLQKLYDAMAGLSVFIAIFVSLFSGSIIGWLYGASYSEASAILTIYVWSGVATFLGVASSQYLLAENLSKHSMYRTLIGMVLNVLLNVLLIPRYGMVGSAVATLVSYFAATFSLVLYSETRTQSFMLMKSLLVTRSFNVLR